MCARRNLERPAVAFAVLLALVLAGCEHAYRGADGSRLDIRLTGPRSPEDVENMIRRSLAQIYPSKDTAESCTIYRVTNSAAHWGFAKAYNAPRGLNMFNVYCYAEEGPDSWSLR